MKVLDFTKETDELENKLIKLGFHYQNTDNMESEGPLNSSRLTITWVNVMNGVTLQIIHAYDRYGDETNGYVKITDDYTNASVNIVGRRAHGIGTDHEQQRQHIPTPGNILQKNY